MKKIGFAALIGALLLSACTTLVSFQTDIEGVDVYMDDLKIGTTPFNKEVSNLAWENPAIRLQKEGYKTVYTELKKEPKAASIAPSVIFTLAIPVPFAWTGLFWCNGPKASQYWIMETESAKVD